MRRAVVGFLVLMLALALVVSAVGVAGAHGDVGEIAAEVTEDADDPTDLTIRARIVYTDDGHPVEDDAVVTFVVGGELEDVAHASGEMTRVGEGEYEAGASVPDPGTYRVTVASENPEARFEALHTVEAAPVTTTTDPADDGDTDDGDDDDVTLSWPVVVAIVVFLGLVAGIVLVAVRQRRM